MLKLINPHISHKEQWKEIMAEWDDSRKRPRIFFQENYEKFLERVKILEEKDDIENQVSKSSLFFVVNDSEKILGFYWLRHNLKFRDDAKFAGHISYGIRPSERGKGHAKEGLRLLLMIVKEQNISEKILIACDDDNIASAKVIEANKGVFESYNYNADGIKCRRYWIDLYQEERNILQSLELELLGYEARHDPSRIEELLADDFFECGKTGTMFGKKECLEWLPAEKHKEITAKDISVHMLSPEVGQVRYIAQIGGDGEELTRSFRTSLWRKTDSGWQMFFHQGTLLQSNN